MVFSVQTHEIRKFSFVKKKIFRIFCRKNKLLPGQIFLKKGAYSGKKGGWANEKAAHGGQWRFFGRGVFAPGQGLFPKYTSGIYKGEHGKLLVGRGLGDSHKFPPRIFNRTEVIIVTLKAER